MLYVLVCVQSVCVPCARVCAVLVCVYKTIILHPPDVFVMVCCVIASNVLSYVCVCVYVCLGVCACARVQARTYVRER